MPEHFGEHLMLDGYGGSYEKLDNKSLVLRLLADLPAKIGMNKLANPVVYAAPIIRINILFQDI